MGKPIRGFTILSEAWYGKANLAAPSRPRLVDQVMFGVYYRAADGSSEGCDYECAMRWIDLSNGHQRPTPEFNAFSDSWAVFADEPTVFAFLAQSADPKQGKTFTVRDFCDLLESVGFVDLTDRKQQKKDPYSAKHEFVVKSLVTAQTVGTDYPLGGIASSILRRIAEIDREADDG